MKHTLVQAAVPPQSSESKSTFPLPIQSPSNRVVQIPAQRPIYPKPPKAPIQPCFQECSWVPPVPFPDADSEKPPTFVSFSGYGQELPPASNAVPEYRATYATSVIPRQRLRSFGHNHLRLDEVLPKSRIYKNGALREYCVNQTFGHELPSAHIPPSSWKCSHNTLDFRGGPTKVFGSQQNDISDYSDSSQCNAVFSDESMESLLIKRLRPSARLLVRIGQQLVQSQFEHMTVNECACGSRTVPKVTPTPHSQISVAPESASSSLVRSESQHLEWQPKPIQQRWTRVRDLCQLHNCPFIPATIFQLHRHLETGHQRFVPSLPLNGGSHPSPLTSVPSTTVSKSRQQKRARLSTRLLIPVVVNMTRRIVMAFRCPICTYVRPGATSLITHIKQVHPFITPHLLERPFSYLCSICGRSVGTGVIQELCRTSLTGSLVHARCSPLHNAYLNAAWAAHDAHPLACLILYPNHHSRILVPKPVAAQLYQAMDFILSTNVYRLKLWTMDSYTLRCSLAVSALYGELVSFDAKSIEQCLDSFELESTISPTSSAPSVVTSVPLSASVSCTPATTFNSVVLNSHRQLGLPAASSITELPVMQSILIGAEPGSKRTSQLSDVDSEPTCKKYCDSRSISSGSSSVPTNGSASAVGSQFITVDLTDDHGAYNLESTNFKQQTQFSSPHVSPIKQVCELCEARVPTSKYRHHLIQAHKCELSSIPSEYCSFCGQLFWTPQGCTAHQRVQCEVCSSNGVCRSTIYIHMALKHIDDLAHSLKSIPVRCLLCNQRFEHIVPHLLNDHFCTIPADVLNHMPSQLRLDLFSKVGFRSYLRELAPLYIVSMSTIRNQLRYSRSFPENVAFKDPTDSRFLLFRCSTCQLEYISAAQLDLHMVQSGHQCWCCMCTFSCRRIRELVNHDSSRCTIKKKSFLKFIRIEPSQNGCASQGAVRALTPSLSVAATASLSDPKMPRIRKTIGSLAQFHGCDLCPVFCLTLEDLDHHRQTAHNCYPLPVLTTASPINPAISASVFTNVYTSAPPTQTVFATGLQTGQTTACVPGPIVPCSVSYQPVVRPTVSVMPSVLPVHPVLIVPATSLPQPCINTSRTTLETSVPQTKSEELVCPMCEFQSTNRNDIMQHITDTH